MSKDHNYQDDLDVHNCQSHLPQDTLDAMLPEPYQPGMEHPTTPEMLDYMMNQDCEFSSHLCNWLNTGLGKKWVADQEEIKWRRQ